jgi:hypothetical protein
MGVKLCLKEEHRLMMFENRVMRRIFEPKRSWHNRSMTEEVHTNLLFTKYYFVRIVGGSSGR